MMDIQQIEVFAGAVDQAAHDLNNLCTSLLGFAELAQYGLVPESREYGYLTEVTDSGQTAIAVAERLRQIASELRKAATA